MRAQIDDLLEAIVSLTRAELGDPPGAEDLAGKARAFVCKMAANAFESCSTTLVESAAEQAAGVIGLLEDVLSSAEDLPSPAWTDPHPTLPPE